MDLVPLAVALAGGGGLFGTLITSWWQQRTNMAELREQRRLAHVDRIDTRVDGLLDHLTSELERYKTRTMHLEAEVLRLTRQVTALEKVTSGPVSPT